MLFSDKEQLFFTFKHDFRVIFFLAILSMKITYFSKHDLQNVGNLKVLYLVQKQCVFL